MNLTNDSNMLALVKKGKCEGCNETARDTEVLHCHLCKNYFHAANCTVRDTLDRDALPAFTNLTNYIKFSSQTYSTGTFIWTCFRCGVVKQLASKDNIDQRVSLLESLLVTLSPALLALTKSGGVDNQKAITKAISEISACTSAVADKDPTNVPLNPDNVPSDNSTDAQPLLPTDGLPPQKNVVGPDEMVLDSDPAVVSGHAVDTLADEKSTAAKSGRGTKIKVRVSSKNQDDPLRTRFHRAHSAGKIGSYTMRYHSNSRADMLFENLDDAKLAYERVVSELEDVEVSVPTCMKTKMIHLVGLTEDDTIDSVYKAICKPGRNRCIEHLVNPCTLRVLSIHPCNKNCQVYRASVVVSEEIWDVILNKMNKKLKIDYLSCSVFPRPDSLRCYRCQRLGHTVHTCSNDITCVVCGEEGHNVKDCKNAPKCINCTESGLDNCHHRADSADCVSYKNFRTGPTKN